MNKLKICLRATAAVLALVALAPAAHADTELTFQLAPRDFSSDSMGSWSLAYERMVDAQFSVGLVFGLADIRKPVTGTSQGIAAALRATHYLQAPSMAAQLQPYVGLELGGATHTDRHSSTLGAFLGARFPMSPTLDLRTDVLVAQRKTTEETLFASNGSVDRRTVSSLRLGVSFRY